MWEVQKVEWEKENKQQNMDKARIRSLWKSDISLLVLRVEKKKKWIKLKIKAKWERKEGRPRKK